MKRAFQLCVFFRDDTQTYRSHHDTQREARASATEHHILGPVDCWEIVRVSDGEVVDFWESARLRQREAR